MISLRGGCDIALHSHIGRNRIDKITIVVKRDDTGDEIGGTDIVITCDGVVRLCGDIPDLT